MKIAVQINGKTRGVVEIDANMSKADIINYINNHEVFEKYFVNVEIIKEIYVPSRLVNFVLS